MKRFQFFRISLITLFIIQHFAAAFAQPVVNSCEVSPNPLLVGKTFNLIVNSSANTKSITALVDLRPTSPSTLRLILAKSGDNWVGGGSIPANIAVQTEAKIVVRLTVLDTANKRTDYTKEFTLKKEVPPPSIVIASPADGAHTTSASIAVSGQVGGTVLSVTVNGSPATLNGNQFSANVALNVGANSITAVANGPDGLSAQQSITVHRDSPPTITINSPADGARTIAASVVVSGQVGGTVLSVNVNGVAANLAGNIFSATVPLALGANSVKATALGPDSLSAEQTITVHRDGPPSISIASPVDGAYILTDSVLVSGQIGGTVLSVTVNGIAAAINGNQFSATVPLAIGPNLLTATANGTDSLTAQQTISVYRVVPSSIQITSPPNNSETAAASILVSGTIGGDVTGVTVNGIAADLNGTSFSATVGLQLGPNTITANATGPGGAAFGSINVVRKPPFVVKILSPAPLDLFATPTITVSGNAGPNAAEVGVNGIQANINPDGTWSVNVPLQEGNNVLTAVAYDNGDQTATDSIQVTLDSVAPALTILTPADGANLTESKVTVTGNINDTVVGTVNDDQATVKVNGLDATVANRTFLVIDVPLEVGPNLITAVGKDIAGNQRTKTLTVNYNPVTGERIEMVSGNNQSAQIGNLLAQPLIVRAVNSFGTPLADQKIIFKVTDEDGEISNGGTPGRSLIVNSQPDGTAQVQFRLGTRAGAGNNRVTAAIVGFDGEIVFTASATPGSPGLLVPDAGNNQIGVVAQPLPKPLVTIVVDAGNNRLHNVPVTFTVKEGGGSFGGQPSITVNSDTDGRSLALLTLGPSAGNDNNVIEANFPGNTGSPVIFVASARVAGNELETSISGVVLDNSDIPVPGVTMRILGYPDAVLSDEKGFFQIKPAPVGKVRLIADGSTATRPGVWVWLQFDMVTIAGQDNDIGRPVRLLQMDMANALFVDETHGGTLTLPHAPGYSLTVLPGSVTFPNGSKSGHVSVTIVHPDKMPDPPSFGQQPLFLVSIQPANAVFNPPAPMCIPNLDGLPPGQKTDMYSYDHDMERFISIGTGTVSEDGLQVCSDPGNGVIKGGWHCGGNPRRIAAGMVSQVSLDKTELVLKVGEEGTVTATGSPTPPHSPISFDWRNGGADLTPNTLSGSSSTATIKGTTPGEYTARVRYRCKSAQWSAFKDIKIYVVEFDFITPAGDPVAAADDSGDGQNEFTFSDASPGVLTIGLKAKVNPASAANKVKDDVVFEVDAVGSSTMAWEAANPGGKSSVSGSDLVATVKFTTLPDANAAFGKKKAKLKYKGAQMDEADYEIFFPKEKRNHPDPDGGTTPNWYHYWSGEAVPGYDRTSATYSYADGAAGAYAEYNGDSSNPKYTIKGPGSASHEKYTSGPLTIDRKGIDTCAATLVHEKTHYQVDLNWLAGGIWNGKADTDNDEVPDEIEDARAADGYDKTKKHSWTPSFIYGDDEEVYCEQAADGTTGVAAKDWANPGKQSKTVF